MLDREDIEAVIACLGDDAAQLRDENPEDERADNMDRAATMLRELADSNAAVARLLLDQDREGTKNWARGLHINMDSEGGLTASADGVGIPNLRRAAERAERVLDQVATDIDATGQLIEWHQSAVEVRDALRDALGVEGRKP